MKKYRVDVKTAVKFYEVEAKNEEEAVEKAFEMYDFHQGEFLIFKPKVVKEFETIKK